MKVRLTTFARDDQSLLELISNRYMGGKRSWKEIDFVIDETYDYLVIFTSPYTTTLDYDVKKAITIMTEAPGTPNRIHHPTSHIEEMYLILPFLPPSILTENKVSKTNLLSIITTDLYYFDRHRSRLHFFNYLDQVIEDGLDIFGKRTGSTIFFDNIKNYRGPLVDKYDGLRSYKYHISCENNLAQNYFTEKIADPIIAECLCFYDGCKNISEFIDERAFIKIDVENYDESLESIVHAIDSNQWTKRIDLIKKQKSRLLNELHPMNIILKALQGRDVMKSCKL